MLDNLLRRAVFYRLSPVQHQHLVAERLHQSQIVADEQERVALLLFQRSQQSKDLLLHRPGEEFHLRNYLRDAYYTYEYKKTSELFIDMRQNYVSMAIVLDEYGATAGVVALEDLLEEIVGEIRDEYDTDEMDLVQKISETEYRVDGSVRLDDLNDRLDIHLESEDYDSLGGYVIGLLDDLPKAGQSVTEGDFRFYVESVDKNRIKWVKLWIPEPKNEPEEEAPEEEAAGDRDAG